jgi:hypothetical protein
VAVAPIHDLPIPSAFAGYFADGERALSVSASIDAAPARSRYFLAKWFDLQGGLYTLKSVTQDAGLWLVSQSQNNGRVVQNVPPTGVVESEVYLPQGRHRLDIVLTNTSLTASSCYVAFSLWLEGRLVYASTGTGWVFDTASIPDASVPNPGDERLALPVFSVLPNWDRGITERVDYLTEILPSESDSEQRRSLRRRPRRSFEAAFARRSVARARLDNFFTGIGNDKTLVPLWHEQYLIQSTLGVTLSFPAGTLAMREFFAGSLVFVTAGDPTVYEVLTIASVDLGADQITFSGAPVRTWPAGSLVAPLRQARVLDTSQMDVLTDNVATVQARFTLVDSTPWPTADWGFSVPYFHFRLNRGVTISRGFERPSSHVLDNDLGPIDVFDLYARTRVSQRSGLTLIGRSQVYAFRRFLEAARGKSVRFWMPGATADAMPIGDFGGLYVDVQEAGFTDYLRRAQASKVMLSILFKDGRIALFRRVISVEQVSTVERIHLDQALPAVALNEVERLSFVQPARFDQDGFELNHAVNDCAVVQTVVLTRSVEIEGMPDIRVSVTSLTYPISSVDSLGPGFAVIAGTLRELVYRAEGILPGVEIAGGLLLPPLLKSYATVPEGVAVAMSVTGGVLDLVVLSYANPEERLSSSLSVIEGTLV